MIKFAKTHRLVSVLVTTAVSILATALLVCVLLPSLSLATDATAMSSLLASGARGPIPGLDTCDTYAVYFGKLDDAKTMEDLKNFDLVILHPSDGNITRTQVEELQEAGVIVLCYVSIGEEPRPPNGTPITGSDGPMYYTPSVSNYCCGVSSRTCKSQGDVACYYLDEVITATNIVGHDGLPDETDPWGSYRVDTGVYTWQIRVKECVTPTDKCGFYGTDYVSDTLGCDGLFLDTIDTASPWHPWFYTLGDMADFICTISDWYPDKYIVLNRGIFFAEWYTDMVRPCINGIVFENYYSEWDWEKGEGKISYWFDHPPSESNRDKWAPKLVTQAAMADGYTVFALDYFTPTQVISITDQISKTVETWGWLDYISTPYLDTIRGEVWLYCRTPTLVSPADGAVISDITPTLTWDASPGVDGYLLDWNGKVMTVGNVTQYTTSAPAGEVYTWTVAAYVPALTSSYADVWSFTVDTTSYIYLPVIMKLY